MMAHSQNRSACTKCLRKHFFLVLSVVLDLNYVKAHQQTFRSLAKRVRDLFAQFGVRFDFNHFSLIYQRFQSTASGTQASENVVDCIRDGTYKVIACAHSNLID